MYFTGLLTVCCATTILVLAFEILKTSRVIKKMKTSVPSGSSLFKLAFTKSTERSNLIERQENGRCRQNRYYFVNLIKLININFEMLFSNPDVTRGTFLRSMVTV